MRLSLLGVLGVFCVAFEARAQPSAPSQPPSQPLSQPLAPPQASPVQAPQASPVQAPPVSNSWPTESLKLQEPMSRRLILNRGPTGTGGYKLERGGVLLLDSRYATGLDLMLAGCPRAADMAHEAHSKLVAGAVLSWTGLGLELASVVGGLVAIGVSPSRTNDTLSTGAAAGLLVISGGVLVGVILQVVGIPIQQAGFQLEFDAVNAYNSDLVDGKLGPAR